MMSKLIRYALIGLSSILLLSSCTTVPEKVTIPTPLREAKLPVQDAVTPATSESDGNDIQMRFADTPKPPISGIQITDSLTDKPTKPRLTDSRPVSINVESLPVAAFINEVFGNVLNLSFNIAPEVNKQRDLVTLRLTEPQTPSKLYDLAEDVLVNYGVSIVQDEPNFLQFVTTKNAPITQIPILARGKALPNVPPSHRPIFQYVPLQALHTSQIANWIQEFYKSPGLTIMNDATSNALIVSGPPEVVNQVIQAIQLLDQPLMRGQNSVRIEPVFLNAEELRTQLRDVLQAEGYAVGRTIRLLAITQANALIAFANNRTLLNHVKQWATTLDKPGNIEVEEESIFFYRVKNTQAEGIAEVLKPLLQRAVGQSAITPAPTATSNSNFLSGQSSLVVDKLRNALIYQGQADHWLRLLPILREMDQTTKQVLIEVTVAEIRLTEDEQTGFNWILDEADLGDNLNSVLSLGNVGFSYQLNYLGQTRALLDVLAKSSENRVTVLSSPRLMVKSGETASINIGDEVPILTSQTTSAQQQGGDSALLQQVQYRSTGITLQIEPIVHGNNQIDLIVSQEISNVSDEPGVVASPIITNRSIQTSLTLSDGGSVLLGGLIDDSGSVSDEGVPGLKDIPVVGNLFKSSGQTRTRRELIMLIVPYIISSNQEAQAITEAFRQRLSIEETNLNLQRIMEPPITETEETTP